jgi:predicted nucleic acid-binding Zn ribbon protein
MIGAQHVLPSLVAAAVRAAPLTPEKVQFAWRTAAGTAIARATEVTLRDDGSLLVRCTDAAWADAIVRMRGQLLRQLVPYLGDDTVRRVVVTRPDARAGEIVHDPR